MKQQILKRFVEIYNAIDSPHVALRLGAGGSLEARFTYEAERGFRKHPSLKNGEDLLDRMLAGPEVVPRLSLLQVDNTFNRVMCQAFMEVYHA